MDIRDIEEFKERYIQNKLNHKEREAFEKLMKENETLKKEVAEELVIRKGIKSQHERQLKQKLFQSLDKLESDGVLKESQTTSDSFSQKKVLILTLFLLALILSYFFVIRQSQEISQEDYAILLSDYEAEELAIYSNRIDRSGGVADPISFNLGWYSILLSF